MTLKDTDLYVYRAVVASVYDGDSIRFDIDLGCKTWLINEPIRLWGIDAWELRGEERQEGLKAKEFVENLLPVGTEVLIRTHKDRKDKYGRWLAEVVIDDGVTESEKDVATLLVEAGHAVYKEY